LLCCDLLHCLIQQGICVGHLPPYENYHRGRLPLHMVPHVSEYSSVHTYPILPKHEIINVESAYKPLTYLTYLSGYG